MSIKNSIDNFVKEFNSEGSSLNDLYQEGDVLKPFKINDKNGLAETENIKYSLFKKILIV